MHFWTPKAGPCMVLMPRLVRLAGEFQGRFLLVMVNTDNQHKIAREYSVNSVPTVKIFRDGKVIHSIYGAESERELKKVIEQYVERAADIIHVEAVRAYEKGSVEDAFQLLSAAQKKTRKIYALTSTSPNY